ncbi:hypothetical protein AgCh_013499 [Apium graveolens]
MIVSFDLGTEEYGLVPGPLIYNVKNISILRELGGKLSLQCNFDLKHFDVCVMEGYGVSRSWTKILSVVQNVDVQFLNLRAMAYSYDGKNILVSEDAGQLFWYDLDLEVIHKIRHPVIPEFWKAMYLWKALLSSTAVLVLRLPTQVLRKTKKSRMDDFPSEGFNLVL